METAEERRPSAPAPELAPEQRARQEERRSLELSRTRVLHDLALATHPRRREVLEAALRHLEERIATLG